jgi:hypothetical protein
LSNDDSDNASSNRNPILPRWRRAALFKQLGPGLVTGAADDDPSGIATYSQAVEHVVYVSAYDGDPTGQRTDWQSYR